MFYWFPVDFLLKSPYWNTWHRSAKVAFLADDFQEGLRAHSGLELSMLPQFLGAEPVPGRSDVQWWSLVSDGDLPGLVNVYITMERSTMFNGKIHYFDWDIFNSYFDITRGYIRGLGGDTKISLTSLGFGGHLRYQGDIMGDTMVLQRYMPTTSNLGVSGHEPAPVSWTKMVTSKWAKWHGPIIPGSWTYFTRQQSQHFLWRNLGMLWMLDEPTNMGIFYEWANTLIWIFVHVF